MRTRVLLGLSVVAVTTSVVSLPTSHATTPTAPDYGVVWTADATTNTLIEYAQDATGTTSPIATISGADTDLNAPTSVAIDSAGTVYATNAGDNSITSYPAGSHGDQVPTTTIEGPKTGLDEPTGLSLVDKLLWLTDPTANVVEAFSVGSDGDVLPAETIAGPKTGLDNPIAVAVTQGGFGGISVANVPPTGAASIVTYDSERPGNIRPDSTIVGSKKHPLVAPSALLITGFGELWVADAGTNTVSLTFNFEFRSHGLHPLRQISGDNTGLDEPSSIAMNAAGDLVVGNAGSHSIATFGRHARDDASPVSTLTSVGNDTGVPNGLAIFGAAPSAPTDLTVKIHGDTASLSWQPSTLTGGGIAGYDVIAFRDSQSGGGSGISIGSGGGGGGLGLHVDTTGTTFSRPIKPGVRYTFQVNAVNAFGISRGSNRVKDGIPTRPSPPKLVVLKTRGTVGAIGWEPPRRDGAEKIKAYRVEYGTCVPNTKGCHFHTDRVKGFQTFATLVGLKPSTTYHVRIETVTKSYVSKPSKPVSFKTGKN